MGLSHVFIAISYIPTCINFKFLFVYWKVVLFWKVNYSSMFDNIMKNKLENTFQYLIMLWKINWKITYKCFIFFKFIKITMNKSYKLKRWTKIKLKKNIISQIIYNKINNNKNNRDQI